MTTAPPSSTVDKPRWRLVAGRALTVLAAVLVWAALATPDDLDRMTPLAFLRLPVEAIVLTALLLALPPRGRRVAAVASGVLIGLLTVLRIADIGFRAALARPFHVLFDWSLLPPAVEFLSGSMGQVVAAVAVVAAVLVAVGLVVLMPLALLRLARLVPRHRRPLSRAVVVAAVVWLGCAAFGVQLVADAPLAAAGPAVLAYQQARQVGADLADQAAFAAAEQVDAFREVPADHLLTGLRGKDVLITFVESYGRDAAQDPQIAALLDDGYRRLRGAGYGARSALLTSSTVGGSSWLAHSTLQSGLWINNPHRYGELVASDRLTLSRAFGQAGWRTVAVAPANTRDWPEGAFYGYRQVYDSRSLGYRGPAYNFASIPDQYTLLAFQRAERATPHPPVMAEIDLLSSHAPWAPIPPFLDWAGVGDGSPYPPADGANDSPEAVFGRDAAVVRSDYLHAIGYSLRSLISYVQTYGDDNLVLVFLGDHQPAPVVTGPAATRDVPITIVARDPRVLDRISDWGWTDGLRPGPQAPVWQMDAFRDRFLGAFSDIP